MEERKLEYYIYLYILFPISIKMKDDMIVMLMYIYLQTIYSIRIIINICGEKYIGIGGMFILHLMWKCECYIHTYPLYI